jgi:hypothetical protein
MIELTKKTIVNLKTMYVLDLEKRILITRMVVVSGKVEENVNI